MGINGKKKGSKNERNLCKWWEAWSGLEFNRVPASGGLRWGNTQNITGDIISTDERHSRRFPFSIETKSYNDFRFEHLILGNKKTKILEFWEQAKEDAFRGSKIPILFARYNGMPSSTWFTVIPIEIYNIWVNLKGEPSYTIVKLIINNEVIIIMNSSDFNKVNYFSLIKDVKLLNRNKHDRKR